MLLAEASGDLWWQLFASEAPRLAIRVPAASARSCVRLRPTRRKDPDDPRPAIADVDAGLLPRAPRPVRVQLAAFEREVEEGRRFGRVGLRRQHAGGRSRGFPARLGAFDHDDRAPARRELGRQGAPDQSAADDDDVGGAVHESARRRGARRRPERNCSRAQPPIATAAKYPSAPPATAPRTVRAVELRGAIRRSTRTRPCRRASLESPAPAAAATPTIRSRPVGRRP